MHGNKDKEALKKVLTPLLSKLNPSAWSVLNKNMIWSQKRPVWLQVCCAIKTHFLTLIDLPNKLPNLINTFSPWCFCAEMPPSLVVQKSILTMLMKYD